MGFDQFKGNERVVESLRRMIASGRLPHSLVLSGPAGVGKFTLATMIARAVNCETQYDRAPASKTTGWPGPFAFEETVGQASTPAGTDRFGEKERHAGTPAPLADPATGDFCGVCSSCRAIAALGDYDESEQFAPLLAERNKLSAEERRDNPLLLSTHPDLFLLPPDGKTQQISIHQVRRMTALAQYRTTGARQRIFLLDHADRMDEVAANAMLKILEEPPPNTLLILTATNYFQLLPTIRSRAIALQLTPLTAEQVEAALADLPWPPAEKRLAARLSQGSPGAARRIDLEESHRLRADLLALLRDGVEGRNFTGLFARTQSLAQAKEETLEKLLGLLYSLLHDILYLLESRQKGEPTGAIRNLDLEKELIAIAAKVDWQWLLRAARRLDRLDRLLRRNINKQVALEALAISLGR